MRCFGFCRWIWMPVLCAGVTLLSGCNAGPSQADIEAKRQETTEREAREKREREAKLAEAHAKAEAERARLRRLQEERKLAEAQAKAEAEAKARAKAEAKAEAIAEAERRAKEIKDQVDRRREEMLAKCDELSGLAEGLSKASLRSDQIATDSTEELERKVSVSTNQVATYQQKAAEAKRQLADTSSRIGWRCPSYLCARGQTQETLRRPGKCRACGTVLVKSDPNAAKRMNLESDIRRYEGYVASYQQQSEQAKAALRDRAGGQSQGSRIEAASRKLYSLRAQVTGAETLGQMEAVERGVADVEATLGAIKSVLPTGLVRAATRQLGQVPADTGKRIYVLNNGSRIEVLLEMRAGNDIIVKTPDGMVSIKKGDIKQTLKQ